HKPLNTTSTITRGDAPSDAGLSPRTPRARGKSSIEYTMAPTPVTAAPTSMTIVSDVCRGTSRPDCTHPTTAPARAVAAAPVPTRIATSRVNSRERLDGVVSSINTGAWATRHETPAAPAIADAT